MLVLEKTQLHVNTPLLFSEPLSKLCDREVYLKLDSLQPSGSFKTRGLGNYCSKAAEAGAKSFASSSGGNAGIAAAYAAQKLGLPMTVVVPESTSEDMLKRIQAFGAKTIKHGIDWQASDEYVRQFCERENAHYVPPFDHPWIWEGNATLIEEIKDEGLKPDAIVSSVGGGGLLCGIVQGLNEAGYHKTKVYAVETDTTASFAAAVRANRLVELPPGPTKARSLAARCVAERALEWSKEHPIQSKVVSDELAVEACKRFAWDHRILVEPSCGASIALAYEKDPDLLQAEKIVLVVCGGCHSNN